MIIEMINRPVAGHHGRPGVSAASHHDDLPATRRVLSNLLRFAELDPDSAGLVLGRPFPTERSSAVPVELQFLFYLAAFLCFALAAVAFRAPWVGRVNLIGLGLALWVFVPLVGALRRVN
jgi:hypothetical protein